jgi:hypothetical protein
METMKRIYLMTEKTVLIFCPLYFAWHIIKHLLGA